MCELLDAADVTHGFLPLPQGRRRDLHLILLIWVERGRGEEGDVTNVRGLLGEF